MSEGIEEGIPVERVYLYSRAKPRGITLKNNSVKD